MRDAGRVGTRLGTPFAQWLALRRLVPGARNEASVKGIAIGVGLVLGVAGCADWHGRAEGDAGPTADAAPPPVGCRPGDPAPFDAYCIYASPDHVCGDAASTPTCVSGAWMCPIGTTQQRFASCWCSGFGGGGPGCVCTPGGWSCPTEPVDAGVDAPPSCPEGDPSLAVGTACSSPGQSCGTCTNPCSGDCNMITCDGGLWTRLDFGCADTTFACGPSTWCSRWSEYCEHILSDVVGAPDTYDCAPLPQDCAADCSCFPADTWGASCSDDHGGGVTVSVGGG